MKNIDSDLFLAALSKASEVVNQNIIWFMTFTAVVLVVYEIIIFRKKKKIKEKIK